jgi:hypothetical protein
MTDTVAACQEPITFAALLGSALRRAPQEHAHDQQDQPAGNEQS